MGASTSSQPPPHEEGASSTPPLPADLHAKFAPTEARTAFARLPPSDGELPTTLRAALGGAEALAEALVVDGAPFRCRHEGETLWTRWMCGLAAACKQPCLADRTAVLVHAALVATEQRQRDGPTALATTDGPTEDYTDRREAGVEEQSSSVEAAPNHRARNPSSPSATGGEGAGGSSGVACNISARDAERWAAALLHVHLVCVALEPALPAPAPNDPMLRSLAATLVLSPHCESTAEAAAWLADTLPRAADALSQLLRGRFLAPALAEGTATDVRSEACGSTTASSSHPAEQPALLTTGTLWALWGSNTLREAAAVELLYDGRTMGFGMNRFLSAVMGYDSSCLLLIGATAADDATVVVGAVVDGGFVGGGAFGKSTRLLGVRPNLLVLPAKPSPAAARGGGGALGYCVGQSAATAASGRDRNAVRGLGVGGSAKAPRLVLDDMFETLTLRRYVSGDRFPAGDLAPPPEGAALGTPATYRVTHVEVWGVGGAAAVARQRQRREQQAWVLAQQRHVDRRAFAHDAAMLADVSAVSVAERAHAERQLLDAARRAFGGPVAGG